MKRSEMIKEMTTTFIIKDRKYEVNQELAEIILNFIEMKGMLPPATLRKLDDDDLFDGEILNCWEEDFL